MIWIDSSFAVEWLLGLQKAKRVKLGDETLGILPMQYAETFTFFLRQGLDPLHIARELESLELVNPRKTHLQRAGFLYVEARRMKSKASMADAILASVVYERKEKVASFDRDFISLGLVEKEGLWSP